MVQVVHGRDDGEDDEHEVKHDDHTEENDSQEHDGEHHKEKDEQEKVNERVPEPRVNAVLQNSPSTSAPTTTTTTTVTTHHANHSHHHHHHHHHHHNESTTVNPRLRATTCQPRSIIANVRELLVNEQTIVVLFAYKMNPTSTAIDVPFETYLIDCLKYTKLEVRINNQSFKNFTIVPGTTLTANQASAIDDLPFLSNFEARLSIAQNRAGEEEYFTDARQARTCYSAPGPVVNLRRSTLANGSLWLEWSAPLETNAPSVCYYQIVVKDLNANNETKHNVNELTFLIPKESLKSQYRITVYAFNDHSCYQNQYPFVEECKKKELGSVGQFIDYRPPSMTTKKPNGADQHKYSSALLTTAVLLASRFFKL